MLLGPYIARPISVVTTKASGILFHYCPRLKKGILGNRSCDLSKLCHDMLKQRRNEWVESLKEFGLTPDDEWHTLFISTKDNTATVRGHLATAGVLFPKVTHNPTPKSYLVLWKHHTAPYVLIRLVRAANALTHKDCTKVLSEIHTATEDFLGGQERVKLNRTFKAWLQQRRKPVHHTEWQLEFKLPMSSSGEAAINKRKLISHYAGTTKVV